MAMVVEAFTSDLSILISHIADIESDQSFADELESRIVRIRDVLAHMDTEGSKVTELSSQLLEI
uniref:Uncharacterized protein n=1 Tax=Leersia perrieri TaxID=77586 RepID=A0A0D9W2H4_9ORYZ